MLKRLIVSALLILVCVPLLTASSAADLGTQQAGTQRVTYSEISFFVEEDQPQPPPYWTDTLPVTEQSSNRPGTATGTLYLKEVDVVEGGWNITYAGQVLWSE